MPRRVTARIDVLVFGNDDRVLTLLEESNDRIPNLVRFGRELPVVLANQHHPLPEQTRPFPEETSPVTAKKLLPGLLWRR